MYFSYFNHYRSYITAFVLSVGVLFFYTSLLHLNIAHAHDAPDYYHRILTNTYEWHPHHVLYEPISYSWSEILKLFYPETHPFKLISAMNSVFGAGCVFFIYLICNQRLKCTEIHSAIISLAIAGSFYYLNYATTVEVYHPALFFTLWALHYGLTDNELNYYDVMMIGIIHGLAMSFHQMHVLLGLVLLPRILKNGLGKFSIYILYGTIIVVITYGLACYFNHIHSLKGFINYFLGYMNNEKIVGDSTSPLMAPLGLSMALLGGRYIMSIEPFKSIIIEKFSDSMFERILYLHHKTEPLVGGIQIFLYALFVVLFFIIIRDYIKKITLNDIKKHKEIYIFIGVYSLFFTFWYPHNPEFWGAPMTFMMIAVFQKITNMRLATAMMITIIGINLLGSGLPLLNPDNNLYPNGIESLF